MIVWYSPVLFFAWHAFCFAQMFLAGKWLLDFESLCALCEVAPLPVNVLSFFVELRQLF